MKTITLSLLLLLSISYCFSQVGVNNTTPQAMLHVTSSNQATPENTDGILIPKADEFPLTNPGGAQNGMLIFVTGNGTPSKGFYWWNNATTSWIPFVKQIDDLDDGKSDNDGTNDGSSIFLGVGSGDNDDSSHNRNIGLGYQALQTVVGNTDTEGEKNIAIGFQSLKNNFSGSHNVGVGAFSLNGNTTGDFNVGVGHNSLNANTTGIENTSVGARSLLKNTTASNNTAFGFSALKENTTGIRNTAVGSSTLISNTTGSNNTSVGYQTLNSNTTGESNVAIGSLALKSNTAGQNNTAAGNQALNSNTTGFSNVAIGAFSLSKNISGINNVAQGNQSLRFNIYGENNVAIGDYAGRSIDDENSSDLDNNHNVILGGSAGNSDINSSNNVYIGYQSGAGDYDPETNLGTSENKSGNVFIGYQSGYNEAGNNKLYIENSNKDEDNALIYGEFDNDILRTNGELQIGNPSGSGYALPTSDGTTNQILITDGNGTLYWGSSSVSSFSLMRATLSSAQALGTSGWEKLDFDTSTFDLNSEFNTTTNRFIALSSGYYRIKAQYHTSSTQGNEQEYGIGIRINNSLVQEFTTNHYDNSVSDGLVIRQISMLTYLNTNDYVEIYVKNFQPGVSIDSWSGKTNFEVERIR